MIKNNKLYKAWENMKTRCYNPNYPKYHRYGGRGIKVCDEWKTNFSAFKDWALNNGYSESLSLDRINGDGNYEPTNCQWIKIGENAKKAREIPISYNGQSHVISEWATILNISYKTLMSRMYILKWSMDKTLSTPVRRATL